MPICPSSPTLLLAGMLSPSPGQPQGSGPLGSRGRRAALAREGAAAVSPGRGHGRAHRHCPHPHPQVALLETNPYLLALTIIVSIVHSVFEFLAFKNGRVGPWGLWEAMGAWEVGPAPFLFPSFPVGSPSMWGLSAPLSRGLGCWGG